MPFILTDDEEYPPGWLRDSWNRDERLERAQERDRYVPAGALGGNPADVLHDELIDSGFRCGCPAHNPPTHCQVCGRALEAQLTCPACGDEEGEQAA